MPDEHRVVAVSLNEGTDRWGRDRAVLRNHVEAGANAPWAFAPPTSEDSFTFPTELSLDGEGRLYIAENVDGDAGLKSRGDDIWVAVADDDAAAPEVARLATLEECDAEVTGLYVAPGGTVHVRVARAHFFFGLVLKN
jgi:secreted PhoX family phosphatase